MQEWTDDRTQLATKLWKEGNSASFIALQLGVTRNAVIGKMHRLGFLKGAGRIPSHRLKVIVRRVDRARALARARAKLAAEKSSPAAGPKFKALPLPPPRAGDVARKHSVLQLTDSDCRYPIGDPKEPGFGFCADKKAPGLPYCEVHARVCFEPRQPRRAAPVHRRIKQVENV
jgi:GcrA cell cycle regulator